MDVQPSMARRFQAAPDVVIERMGDTMLAVHLGSDKIIELNETAAHLVDLLLGGSTDEEAATELAKIYDEYFTTPYLQKRLRVDCGVVRTAWNMANMLNNWVVKNERPDQKSLDEVKSELSMYEENTARFKNLYERALALYPDVPANRRDFYQFHVLTTLDLYRRAFATNAMLADAVLAMAEGDRDKAIGHARTAVDEFDRIFSALRKAEYPPWRGWHAGEIFVHLTPTRHAIIRCSASLSGEAPPPPINVRENYRRIQEYQEPFLKNFPLMYPPKTR